MKHRTYLLTTGLLIAILPFQACDKYLEIAPPRNQLVTGTVFSDDNSATAAVVGVYSNMMQTQSHLLGMDMTLDGALLADELSTNNPSSEYPNNTLTADNPDMNSFWSECYFDIYSANAIITGLNASTAVTPATKDQLLGEAEFIRAYCHFYLTNLWGDVPLITTSNYLSSDTIGRTPQAQVYQQIVADLKDAQNLLAADYSYSNGERTRPNKWAATALLARAYLYTQDWADAEAQADAIIASGNSTLLHNPDSVFLKDNKEAIWQLAPVIAGDNTWDGLIFIPASATVVPSSFLTSGLLGAFEPGDLRRTHWVDSSVVGGNVYYYPYKYKVRTGATLAEYNTVLRLAEQYLIRAEARARQQNVSGAQSDLDIIRARAGLPNTTAADQASLLLAIEQERRIELFAEWGHRWLDLKRTGRADAVLGALKPGWKSTDVLWPVPVAQLNANSRLRQNTGY